MSPRITVVVPVHNRRQELTRALQSLERQTFDDFECIVVDDASEVSLESAVSDLHDRRFRYLRQPQNGGPYSARVAAFRAMEGDVAVGLDSDQEAYPWMLSRIAAHLEAVPDVGGVAGMYVDATSARQLVTVEGGSKLMVPAEYRQHPAIPDCVGAVRQQVVAEWLEKRDDYFALEVHQWFTFHMRHSQLFVDEPWARMHMDAADRVSRRADDRVLDDYNKFLEEHMVDLRETDAVVLDELVAEAWFKLRRAGRHEDAARYAEVMEARGLSKWETIAGRVRDKVQRLVRADAAGAPYRLR